MYKSRAEELKYLKVKDSAKEKEAKLSALTSDGKMYGMFYSSRHK